MSACWQMKLEPEGVFVGTMLLDGEPFPPDQTKVCEIGGRPSGVRSWRAAVRGCAEGLSSPAGALTPLVGTRREERSRQGVSGEFWLVQSEGYRSRQNRWRVLQGRVY